MVWPCGNQVEIELNFGHFCLHGAHLEHIDIHKLLAEFVLGELDSRSLIEGPLNLTSSTLILLGPRFLSSLISRMPGMLTSTEASV